VHTLQLVDVATGSGAVAVALARLLPEWRLIATDVSPDALEYAARNVNAHGLTGRVELRRGDLLDALPPDLRVDGVVANLPYVAETDWPGLPPEVRDHEPPEALLGGADGLDLYRRLAAQLPARLAPGGFVALEVGAGQAPAVTELLRRVGLFEAGAVKVHRDLAGIERVVGASGAGCRQGIRRSV